MPTQEPCPGLPPEPAPDDRCGCTFRFNDDGSFMPLTECTYHIDRMKAGVPDVAGWLRERADALTRVMHTSHETLRASALREAADAWTREHPAGAGKFDAALARGTAGAEELRVKLDRLHNGTMAGRASGPDQPLSAAGRGAVVDEPCSTPPHATRMPPDEPGIQSGVTLESAVTTPAAAPSLEPQHCATCRAHGSHTLPDPDYSCPGIAPGGLEAALAAARADRDKYREAFLRRLQGEPSLEAVDYEHCPKCGSLTNVLATCARESCDGSRATGTSTPGLPLALEAALEQARQSGWELEIKTRTETDRVDIEAIGDEVDQHREAFELTVAAATAWIAALPGRET